MVVLGRIFCLSAYDYILVVVTKLVQAGSVTNTESGLHRYIIPMFPFHNIFFKFSILARKWLFWNSIRVQAFNSHLEFSYWRAVLFIISNLSFIDMEAWNSLHPIYFIITFFAKLLFSRVGFIEYTKCWILSFGNKGLGVTDRSFCCIYLIKQNLF